MRAFAAAPNAPTDTSTPAHGEMIRRFMIDTRKR